MKKKDQEAIAKLYLESKEQFNFRPETCDVKILQKTNKGGDQFNYKILVKTKKRPDPLRITVTDYTLSNAKPSGFDYVRHEPFPKPYLDEFKNANEGDIIKDLPFWVISNEYNYTLDRIKFARQDAEDGYSHKDTIYDPDGISPSSYNVPGHG